MSNIKFTNEKSMDVEKDVDKSIESPLDTEGNVENTLENIDQDLSNIEDSSAAIDNLLNDPNLTEKERSVYRAELSTIKKDTSDFKNRLKKIGEKVLESIGKGIGNTIEAYSYRFGENRKKIKTIDFILDNLELENIDEIRSDYEDKKKNHNLWGIKPAEFPLNDTGVRILKMLAKKNKINSFYSLEELINSANNIYNIHTQEKISLDCLSKLQMRYGFNYRSDSEKKEDFDRLRLIDKYDIYKGVLEINFYSLEKISIDKFKFLLENEFIKFEFHDYDLIYLNDIEDFIDESSFIKAADFFGKSKVNIRSFDYFIKHISNYDPRVQELFKGKNLNNMIYSSVSKILDKLDPKKNDLLIALVEKEFVELSSEYELRILDELEPEMVYKMKKLSEIGFEDHHYGNVLREINSLSDGEFDLFINLLELSGGLNKYIKSDIFSSCKGVYKKFKEESINVLRLMKRAGNLENILSSIDVTEYYLDRIRDYYNWVNSEKDIDMIDLSNKVFGQSYSRSLDTFDINNIKYLILNNRDAAMNNSFIKFEEVSDILSRKNIEFSAEEKSKIFNEIILYYPTLLLKEFSFPLNKEQKKRVIDNVFPKNPSECLNNLDFITSFYLKDLSKPEKQDCLDSIFSASMSICPMQLLSSKDFPFTSEQLKYVELFDLVSKSQSSEFKNLADQIVPMMSKYEDFDKAKEVLSGIEKIFLTNNIPAVGKQYKVFELMYNDSSLQYSVNRSFVESLKSLKENSRRRLTIFKDLLRSHISSCDSNLYSYLTFLSENRSILSRFESGEKLSEDDRNKIKLFIKKINVLSGHMGRYSIDIEDNISDNTLRSELGSIASSFGVKDGENIIDKFERIFLQRIGISSVEEALKLMDQYKQNAHQRNILNSSNNRINVKAGDFIKGMNSNFLDTYLDKGVYSPEFIGAETENAKSISKSSDSTPFDTDLSIFEDDKLANGFTGYGDMYLILKDKDQFKRDDLDIFKTGVINQKHYGIRTGFGSTNIDAICVGDTRPNLDKIKYFVAEKGFYIPICDKEGKVIFTLDEYNRYRDVFSGTHKSEKPIKISIDSVKNEEIDKSKQTEEGVNEIKKVKDVLINKIKSLLEDNGILFHKGEYEDSLLGAIITDTGSTGRGSALDEKFDFDFAVKLDDKDFSKVDAVISKLGQVFEKDDSYENKGMKMFRSKELEIDGHYMTIDVGFVKKSDAGNFDAHDALREKYDSIEKVYGKDKLLEVLTNIRFAKKKLKEAGCYKKGLGDNGQQGGLGGIGVEYWVLQNGGDAIKAFKDFLTNVYEEDSILSFDEFKKKYKIFSAGQNIRGGVKVENFVYNMSPEGYSKMIKLALELTQ